MLHYVYIFISIIIVFDIYSYTTGRIFYIGFIPHFGSTPSISLLTNCEELMNYSIEAPVTRFYDNGTIMANIQNTIQLPDSLSGLSRYYHNSQNDEYKEGIYLHTTGDKLSVIGKIRSHLGYNFETFFSIPVRDLCIDEYTYFAVSLSTDVLADGSVVIVGTVNQTTVNITVPVSAQIKFNNSANWSSLDPGRLYSFEIQRLQILYIAVFTTDLSGSKITTNKPISLFSGHECAFIPYSTRSCDLLMEQIPPTELWGTTYYFAPLASRVSYAIKIIAAYSSTVVDIYCNNTVNSYTINAGMFIEVTYRNQEFCGVNANDKVLVVQFSLSYNSDLKGDPMMTLVPATTHYTNNIISSTFQPSMGNVSYKHYINIVVLASFYQPDMISVTYGGGLKQSLGSQNWVPIISRNVTEAYACQVTISHDVFEVAHSNDLALMTVVVYGFAVYLGTDERNFAEGYGHPGWLMHHYGMCLF